MMYNSSLLSLYTPESFYLPENLKTKYKNNVKNGFKISKGKKVVFASLLRDVEERMPAIEKKVERLGKLFADYHVLIVENDSNDGTRQYLLDWAKRNPKITVLGCGKNFKGVCSIKSAVSKTDGHFIDRKRINKMVDLRNIYLNEIKKSFQNYDYAVFWDLDMIGSVYIDGVAHTMDYLERSPDVDVVCAYGIYRWTFLTLFYDSYAFLDKKEKYHIDMHTPHHLRKALWDTKYNRGDDPVEVDSCFSGFAVYRMTSLSDPDVIYDMSPETNLECEHVRLHMKIKGKKTMNPSMINLVLENS